MVYDEVNDIEYDDFFDVIEDFGFAPTQVATDGHVDLNSIQVATVRKLYDRLDNHHIGWNEAYSRHILAVGRDTEGGARAYAESDLAKSSKVLFSGVWVVNQIGEYGDEESYVFYVGAVPKSA